MLHGTWYMLEVSQIKFSERMPYLLVTTHIRLEAGPCIGGQNVNTPMISVSFSICIFLNAQSQLLTKYSHSSSCIQCKIFGHSGKVTLSHMANVVVGDIFLVWDTWSMMQLVTSTATRHSWSSWEQRWRRSLASSSRLDQKGRKYNCSQFFKVDKKRKRKINVWYFPRFGRPLCCQGRFLTNWR